MASLLLAIIYISFISLGLPDALLGASWPVMQTQLQVPISYAGGISILISLGTIVSSLQSDRMTKWLGAGKVTAYSARIRFGIGTEVGASGCHIACVDAAF